MSIEDGLLESQATRMLNTITTSVIYYL